MNFLGDIIFSPILVSGSTRYCSNCSHHGKIFYFNEPFIHPGLPNMGQVVFTYQKVSSSPVYLLHHSQGRSFPLTSGDQWPTGPSASVSLVCDQKEASWHLTILLAKASSRRASVIQTYNWNVLTTAENISASKFN